FGAPSAQAMESARKSAASVLLIRFAATARSIPLLINARSVDHGGFAEADPESSMAASASTAARLAARSPMKGQTVAACRSLWALRHDFDALGLRRGAPPLALEHLAQGADRDLELVERRLARRQPLEPEARCEQGHQDPVLGVLAGEADQLVRDPGDHRQQ